MIWAVVPAKDLGEAKHRLAGLLSPAERQALFFAMVEDVLGALVQAPSLYRVAVVTRDPELIALSRLLGVEVLEEETNRGHTQAVTWGAQMARARGAEAILTVPGDVPLITPEEVEMVIGARPEAPSVVFVPSRDEQGTNAVLLSPPDAIPLRFGENSFYPHLATAKRLGVEATVLHLPGIGLDIDTPEDLAALLSGPKERKSIQTVQTLGVEVPLHIR